MFIRRTKTRSTSSGSSYFSHRLVRSKRIDGKVRQRTLLNLGRHFAIDQSLWQGLCARIEQLLDGQQTLVDVELSAEAEQEAQRIVARLVAEQGVSVSPSGQSDSTKADIQSIDVDVDSLELVRPRSVGVEHLALWAMEQVHFLALLRELGLNGRQQTLSLGNIIARLCAPASERESYRWLCENSALGELLGVDYEALSLMGLYRASDVLLKHREAIEAALFERACGLFGLEATVTLYDLTNTYFEGEAALNPKARRGHSKEKRSDCPLLTLGLILDGSGFVRRSEVFAGNASEARSLQQMLAGLDAPPGALVVMDAGIATEANLKWLDENGYRYLAVSRERHRQFEPSVAQSLETADGSLVHFNEVRAEDGRELRLYCHSEARSRKEEGITRRFAERFEAALERLNEGLSRPRTTKRPDKLWERIGRLKEKSRGAAQHYHIELITDEGGERAVQLRWERKPVDGTLATHPGVYCLRSNETTWDGERLWRTYIMLTDLEAVFRSLKSELGLRPVYHHKEERADGHLFITVLAYQFVQIIRRRLQEKGIEASWRSLRHTLQGQCRVSAVFRRADGRTLHVRKATRAEPQQLAIYEALGMEPTPGGINKLLV